VDQLTNCPDCFQKLNFPSRFAPSTATITEKNEIGKPGLFHLVYLVGFNSQGLNLAQKGCTETRLLCFRNYRIAANSIGGRKILASNLPTASRTAIVIGGRKKQKCFLHSLLVSKYLQGQAELLDVK